MRLLRKLKKLRDLKKLENLKSLDNLTNEITRIIVKSKEEFQKIKEGCNNLGLEDKTFDAMVEGKDIIDCIFCNTHNMCEIFYNKKDKRTMYECYHCNKTYMVKK